MKPTQVNNTPIELGETGVVQRMTEKEQEGDQEIGVWVLLSIIFYMTMIREQGMSQMIVKKKKKKKKKRLLQQGIIYAYQP